MQTDLARQVGSHPSTRVLPRILASTWRQGARSAGCPDTPRLDGQRVLVTGGGGGIGLETSRGLAARGAEVIAASRSQASGAAAMQALQAEFGVPAHFVPLDLGDLRDAPRCLDRLAAVLAGRSLDGLVANAGLWPLRYATSAQGHEVAFATNVLGHHALIRGALERGLLADGARVILVTGDIYVMARECTPDYVWRGVWGGQLAYCRSKLGNLWQARELARRQPSLRVHAVHPGVIASGLAGGSSRAARGVKRLLMLSPERGAQTTLFCASQPGLASGTYYHNTLGRVALAPDDPGADDVRAGELWERLEGILRSEGCPAGGRSRSPRS